MFSVNRHSGDTNRPVPRSVFPQTALLRFWLLFAALFGALDASSAPAQQVRPSSVKGGVAELSSTGPQKRQGNLTIADGAVDIHYANQRLQADHVEYNEQTYEAMARGHVVFDYENQHLEADEAHYNISTGRGTFTNVRGTVKIVRRPNPTVLITDNPLYFQAKTVERFGNDLYFLSG